MESSALDLPAINQRIHASAFNRWLRIEATRIVVPGQVELRMPSRAELEGGQGMTHGGIFACIVDVAAFAAILSVKGQTGPTIDMRVDFHANAFESDFIIEAQVLRAGSRIATGDVKINSVTGKLLASGRCVYVAAR
ncbi:PaaI family thioesterase [Steroidobacter sp.]|uniref:PaaI family thioesterase n=1 Tax=Steroidobacter sp. TaxID=1978227 RepID=UPI001A3C67EC|nr:PaaI family thioesterase [Steroidobacter sp.]MBL8270341.1 PaaI family thioesterase [Steroidobacter sp.]